MHEHLHVHVYFCVHMYIYTYTHTHSRVVLPVTYSTALLGFIPVLDGGGQTWPTEVSDSAGRAEDGGGGASGRSEGSGSQEEIR